MECTTFHLTGWPKNKAQIGVRIFAKFVL